MVINNTFITCNILNNKAISEDTKQKLDKVINIALYHYVCYTELPWTLLLNINYL